MATPTPDDETPQPAPPPPSSVNTANLNTILQGLLAPTNQPVPKAQPVDTDANAPTSWAGLLGEHLAGGAPSDVDMTKAQRESAGRRALLNFSAGMMSVGPFDTLGQGMAAGIRGAESSQYSSEGIEAQRQVAAQDWQQQQIQNRISALKEAMPLLQLQMGPGISAGITTALGGGSAATGVPGSTPGTSIAEIARDPKAGTAGQQGNNPGNVMADNGLPPGAIGRIPVAGGRYVAAFPNLTTGIAANAANLASYAASGTQTVKDAVTRWVGDPKADLTSYIADISKALGVGPNDKIDLTDPKVQSAFIMAQQPHESGKLWLTPADVAKGVATGLQTAKGSQVAQADGKPTPAPAAAPAGPTQGKGFGAGAFGSAGAGATLAPQPQDTASAPNVPVDLPAVPTPQMAAAQAIANKTGKPAPIEGTPGLFAKPGGGVTLGAGAGGLGKRADADAIQQGIQTAATTLPAPSVSAAGPAAGGGTTAAETPPAPPAGRFGGGAFGTTVMPAAPIPPPPATTTPAGAPAQQIPTMATQPSGARTPYTADADIPDPNDRKASYPPFIYQQSPNLNTTLPPAAEAQYQGDRANLINAIKGTPYGTDQYKAFTQQLADLGKQHAQDIATHAQAIIKMDADQQQQGYKLGADTWNQVHQAGVTSDYKLREINATSDAQASTKALEDVNEAGRGASQTLQQIEMARQLSAVAGTPNFIEMHPDLTNNLIRTGLLSPDEIQRFGAQQALNGVINKMVLAARQGSGMSRMTNMDLQFLQNTAPGSFTPEEIRGPMLAALQTTYQRQAQYAHIVNSLHGSGMPVWQAEQKADEQLGSIIAKPPDFADIADPNAKLAAQGRWISQNVPNGSFYLKPNGQLAIRGAPQKPQQQPGQ